MVEPKRARIDTPSPAPAAASPAKKPLNKAMSMQMPTPLSRLLEGVVLVISGIENPERAKLRDLAMQMGATYRPQVRAIMHAGAEAIAVPDTLSDRSGTASQRIWWRSFPIRPRCGRRRACTPSSSPPTGCAIASHKSGDCLRKSATPLPLLLRAGVVFYVHSPL